MYGDSEATERENRQLAHHQDALYEDDGFDQWGSVHFDEIDAEDDDAGPPEGLYDEYLGASTAVAPHDRGSTMAIAAVLVHAQQQQHEAEAAAAALANVVATNLQLQAVSPWVPMEDGPEEPLLLHATAAGLTAAMACWAALQVPLRVWRALLRRRDRRTAAAQALRNRFAVLERNGGPAADMQLLVAECRLPKRLPESDVAAMQGAADLCSLRERAHALCERASAALQRVQRLVLDSGDEQLHALSTGGGGGGGGGAAERSSQQAPVPLAALARELSEMIAQCREREAQLTDEVALLEAREAAVEEALECGRRYVSAHLRGHSLRGAEAALRRARALRLFDGADEAAAAAAARRLVAELRAARQRSNEQLRQLIADVRLAAGDDSGDDGGGDDAAAALLPRRAPPALALDKQRLQVAVCLAKRQDFTDLPAYAHATALVHEVDAAEERWLRDWHARAAARAASGYQENARSMMSIISRMTCLSIDDGRGGSSGAPVVSCTEDEINGQVALHTRDGDVMERHAATVNGVETAVVTSTQLTVAAFSTTERPPAVNGAAAHPPPQQPAQSQSQIAGYISITSDMMRAQDKARRDTDAHLLELREKHKQQWLAANEEAGQLLRQTTHFKMAEDLHREQQRFEVRRAEEKRAHRDALEARQRQKEEREREEAALDTQLECDLAALNRWGRAGPLLACAVAATALLTRGSVWSLVAHALSGYFHQCDNPAPPASYPYAHYYPSFSPWDLLSWAVPASAARTYCQLSLALRAAVAAAPLALLQRALPALAGSAAMPLAAALCASYAVTGHWLPVAFIARALWLPAPAAIAAAAAAAARRRRRQRRCGWGSACVHVGVPAAVVAAAAWCGLRVGCPRGGGSGECAARVLQALRQHASEVLARM